MGEVTNKLAEMNDVFDNQTLTYRINGFAEACAMNDLDIKGSRTSLFRKNENGEEKDHPDYYISVSLGDIQDDLEDIRISGYYDDLNFDFNNYHYKNVDLDSDIVDLPFNISLYKTIRNGDKTFEDTLTYVYNSDGKEFKIDNWVYHLDITDDDEITMFTIKKYKENRGSTIISSTSFYIDSVDFSEILKVIKSFVYNPELLYMNINETMSKKKIKFNNSELNRMLMEDKKLDKPVIKIKK